MEVDCIQACSDLKILKIFHCWRQRSFLQFLFVFKNKKFNITNQILETVIYNPDYILVCSETYKHYQHIKLIENNFKNKIILVEKPLFHKFINFNFKNNRYFVGYNLRFHPVVKFLKDKIKFKNIFSVSISKLF